MQLSAMQTLCSQRLNEGASGPVFYPASEILAALNEGLRFFCLLTLGLETTAPWAVPAGATFFHMLSYFADWLVPLRIATAAGAQVKPAGLADLLALDSGWIASPGSPVRYCSVGGDLIGLYQQPAAAGTVLQVTYAQAPAPLVNPTDTPAIPSEYHPDLVKYGVYRLRQVEGAEEFQKVLDNLNEYLDACQRYANYVRARNLGPRYDKLPFELESFDRSQLLALRKDLPPSRGKKAA